MITPFILPVLKQPYLSDRFISYPIGIAENFFGNWKVFSGTFEVVDSGGIKMSNTGGVADSSFFHQFYRLGDNWTIRAKMGASSTGGGVHWGVFTDTSLADGYSLGYDQPGSLDVVKVSGHTTATILASTSGLPSGLTAEFTLRRRGTLFAAETGRFRVSVTDTTYGACPIISTYCGAETFYDWVKVSIP